MATCFNSRKRALPTRKFRLGTLHVCHKRRVCKQDHRMHGRGEANLSGSTVFDGSHTPHTDYELASRRTLSARSQVSSCIPVAAAPCPPRLAGAPAARRTSAGAMLLWAYFGITTMVGSAAQMLQRVSRGPGSGGRGRSPEPRDWALRRDAPGANFARPAALERDVWARRRAELDEDVWADQRYTIDAPLAGPRVHGNPRRRRYILDSLDGGEAYYRFRQGRDMPREKIVPNNGPHRVARKVAGKWVPVPVVNGRPVEPEEQDAR